MGIELPIDHVAFGTTDLERAIEIVAGSGLSMTPLWQSCRVALRHTQGQAVAPHPNVPTG